MLKFNQSDFDLEWPISQLLRDNKVTILEDKEFLLRVFSTKFNRRYKYAFNEFLSNSKEPITVFSDLIIKMAESAIEVSDNRYDSYFDEDDIVKLVIGLYDKVSGQNTEDDLKIAEKCLDIWALMFQNQIGSAGSLSFEMMQR